MYPGARYWQRPAATALPVERYMALGDVLMLVPKSLEPHTKRVLEGEYDIPELNPEKPVVLDIGANVGAFAIWAAGRWPGCSLRCYEPNPENFELLTKNLFEKIPHYTVINAAVWDSEGEKFLYDGYTNQGECSLFHDWRKQETGHTVRTINAASLPPCDILKIDTEGSESIILGAYPHLETCSAVMLEWHSLSDRYHLGALLLDLGFLCVSDAAWAIDCGVMKMTRLKNFQQKLYYTTHPPELAHV